MQDYIQISSLEEAQFNIHFEAECKRKEKLMAAFEKMEKREKRRKNPNNIIFKRKYERVTKGYFVVEQKKGDFLHLVDENGKKLGALQATSEVTELARINDGLEGVFGFRDGYWRVQFLFCIASSTDDFMPTEQ